MLRAVLVAAALVVATASSPALAAPKLVVDLQTQNVDLGDGDPSCVFDAGGHALFAGQTIEDGRELWRTDGTLAGTSMIADLAPGSASGSPCGFTSAGDVVYFTARDGAIGATLWRTDGTKSGTFRVTRDVVLGATPYGPGSYPTFWMGPRPIMAALGTKLLFAANDLVAGDELWITDGTAQGTTRVKDIASGPNGSSPYAFTALGNCVYFAADDGVHGRELWRTDGTEQGTTLVSDVNATGASWPEWLTVTSGANGTLFFAADDGVHGRELFAYDGTQSTLVRDIAPSTGSNLGDLVALGSEVFFVADDGTHGAEIWRSNGKLGQTRLVADLNPTAGSNPQGLAAIGTSLYFGADDGLGRDPFRFDTTGGSIVRLRTAGSEPADANVLAFMAVGSGVVFYGGYQTLWFTDGTANAAHRLPITVWGGPWPFGGKALVTGASPDGIEPWITDGTDAGTKQIADISPKLASSNPSTLAAVARGVFFVANGHELWSSDGTATGTTRLPPAPAWPWLRAVTPLGADLLFAAASPTGGLWKTDGTVAGTSAVWANQSSAPSWLTPFGNDVLFTADDGTHGRELWKTNGTAAGTSMIVDITPDPSFDPFPGPQFLTATDHDVFFFDRDDVHGQELWASDGTPQKTRLVSDMCPGACSSTLVSGAGDMPSLRPVALGAQLIFGANDGVHGREPWRSDGTAQGTSQLADVAAGATGSSPTFLGSLGARAFFVADEPGHGPELFQTDGTAAGTLRLAEIRPGPFGSSPATFLAVGTFALFAADDGPHGTELWRTDGTAAGTTMVVDLAPGFDHGAPDGLTLLGCGGPVIFAASDGISGMEPWLTDGTAAGTRRIADIAPGPRSSNPTSFAVSGRTVYFTADDGVTGRELWSMDLGDLGPLPALPPDCRPPTNQGGAGGIAPKGADAGIAGDAPPASITPPRGEDADIDAQGGGCACRAGRRPLAAQRGMLVLLLGLLPLARRRVTRTGSSRSSYRPE